MTSVINAHRQLAGMRETNFEFDALLDQGDFGIGGFHVQGWVRANPLPRLSNPLCI